MYETPKNNINDDNEEEPYDLRPKLTQTTTIDRVEGKIFLRDEKTSPEEHESAAILFELMSGSSRLFSQEGQKQPTKKRKKSGNATNNTMNNKNANKMTKKTVTSVTNTMKTTKRRLSAKFADVEETRAHAASAEKEKRKKREPKKEETTNASMMKREKQGQLQQRKMFLNDFVCKQLEADASVPKSWVAFARATARGEDAAVIEASTCLDDAEDEFKSRRKTTATTTTSSKKKTNIANEDEDEDEDEENEAGVEDQNGVFMDAACRRARYSKGVTKLSADLIRENPSAAWLECIAADAHDRARQIRRTKKRCEKMRKQSIAAMFRGKTMNEASAQSNREAAVEDVSAIALANICANWELGLAKEIELYCDQLENVELISEKAIAESTTPSSSEERTFSMEQFERSDDPEHQKAKRLATKLRTHSEKVAALWRHNAKGRNAF